MNEDTNTNDKLRSKDTRWDRIRKRHMNSLTVKTDTVKKFIAMDFIGKDQIKVLAQDASKRKVLDPALVMNLRHEMVRSKGSRRHGVTVKDIALENTKSHNKSVEEHYIESELKKFRCEMEKSRRSVVLRPQISLNLSNDAIFNSLDRCSKHTLDFYKTIQNSLQLSNDSNTNNFPPVREEEVHSDKVDTVERCVVKIENKEETVVEKSVRFEDSVEVINYLPQDDIRTELCSSNTSSDVDSVASDIVEDIFQEVRNEAEIEMIGKSFQSLQKTSSETVENYFYTPEKPLSPQRRKDSSVVEDNTSEPFQVKKLTPIEHKIAGSNVVPDEDESATSKSSETASNEQTAIISELFNSKVQNSVKVLRKYFLRWTHAITISKIEKMNLSNKNDRFQKINCFLDKIRREKRQPSKGNGVVPVIEVKENSIVLAKKYQNKIKIQQDIIDLQKIKLERQERLIMQLKLNKLLEGHKQSREDVRQELKAVIKTGDAKIRTKAKCLQLVGNLRDKDDEDEFARLQGKALMMPKFLVNMQERALERNVKHEQAKQRRLQMEAEREAAKIAAEEAKRLEDEEAKQRRIEALKEKRRLDKLAKLERERERLRAIENNKKCQEFRRQWLLRSIGMEAFKRLLKRKRKLQRKAEIHRKLVVTRKAFQNWNLNVQSVWMYKNNLADKQYIKTVQRIAFRAWTNYHLGERSKFLVAVDWYDLKITEAIFQQWLGLMKLQKLIEDAKSVQAVSHYEWNLRWKVLDHWRRLPQVLKIEKETEARRQRWRVKIWELLPDYQPNIDK